MTSSSATEIIVAGGGGILLFAVLTFGTFRRVSSRRKIVRSMSDSNPTIRTASIVAAERHGLSWYVDALTDRTLAEEDPEVRAVLAEALIRNPWEPGADPRRALLERWAQRILTDSPDERRVGAETDGRTTGISAPDKDSISVPEPLMASVAPLPEPTLSEQEVAGSEAMDEPEGGFPEEQLAQSTTGTGNLVGTIGTSDVASLLFQESTRGAPSVNLDPLSDPFGESRFALPNEFNDVSEGLTGKLIGGSSGGLSSVDRSVVLVTGAGSSVGMVMIRALRSLGYRVVAADSDPLATGMHMADDFGVLPAANDRRFLPELLNLADRSGARILIPTVVEEFFTLSAAKDYLKNIFGLNVWLPNHDAIVPCWDRWSFVQKGREAGLSIPASGLGSADGVEGPWVVKSRYARGSNNVRSVDDLGELEFVMGRTSEPIVQHRLSGREFTVDALAVSNGEMLGAVLQSRLATKSTGSVAFETFSDGEVTNQVRNLLGVFGLEGPVKVQGFISDGGEVSLIGVKPTFSSGLSLSIAAGADLMGEYVHAIEGMAPRPDRLQFQAGVRMFRSFVDIFER